MNFPVDFLGYQLEMGMSWGNFSDVGKGRIDGGGGRGVFLCLEAADT